MCGRSSRRTQGKLTSTVGAQLKAIVDPLTKPRVRQPWKARTGVILTIGVEDLLAKSRLAETSHGSQLTPDQLLRIADEADIWPTIINQPRTPHEASEWRRTQSNINRAIPTAIREPRSSSAFLPEALLRNRERICQISSV